MGFILLTDCASVVMASVLGIDKKYGVTILPPKETSWAGVRDKLVSSAWALRALSMEPQVLLMDEPFGALDALTRAKLQDGLLEIVARTHSTVVMVTHDVDEGVLLPHKIVMMTNGPSATMGNVLSVDLPRQRNRVELAESTHCQHYRKAVIVFFHRRQAHVEKMA